MKTAGDAVAVSDEGVGVPTRQEVMFRDGSAVDLHRVVRDGIPDLYRRELGTPAAGVQIDLRELAPTLGDDLPKTATRDVPGVVFYTLRHQFKCANDLVQAALTRGSYGR